MDRARKPDKRKEAAVNDWLRQCVGEAFADPRPNVPAREVFQRRRQHHAEQVKTGRNEKIRHASRFTNHSN